VQELWTNNLKGTGIIGIKLLMLERPESKRPNWRTNKQL
jgi:hypothetical protein